MSPVTHLLLGWTVANAGPFGRRERALVTLAGVLPDADAIGVVVEWASGGSRPWYSEYHHVLAHNLFVGLALAGACALGAKKRARAVWAAVLGLASFHLHLLCDLLGSKGPDGAAWEISYLWPLARGCTWQTSVQWELASWQNLVVTAAALAVVLCLAWWRGFSPLEMVSPRADAAVVATLRRRVAWRARRS